MPKNQVKYNASLPDIQANDRISFDKYVFSEIKTVADLDELQIYWVMQAHRISHFSLSPSTYNFLARKARTTPQRVQRIIEKCRRKGVLMRRTKAGWCVRIGWRKVSAILANAHEATKEDTLNRRWTMHFGSDVAITDYANFKARVVGISLTMYEWWLKEVVKDTAKTAVWYKEVSLASQSGAGGMVISHRHLSAISPIRLGSVARLIQHYRTMARPGVTLDADIEKVPAGSDLEASRPAHLTRSRKQVCPGAERSSWDPKVAGTRIEVYDASRHGFYLHRIRQPNLLVMTSKGIVAQKDLAVKKRKPKRASSSLDPCPYI